MRRLFIGLCLLALGGCAPAEQRWGDYAPPIDVGLNGDAARETDAMVRDPDAGSDVSPGDTDGAPAETDMAPSETDVAPTATDAGPAIPDMIPVEQDMAPLAPDMTPLDPDMAPPELDMTPPDPDMAPPEPDMVLPDPDMALPEPDMALPDPDMAPPQNCLEGDVRALPCGLNDRGMQPQRCVDDAWIDDGPCADPDRCVDGVIEEEACGLNDRGTRRRVCFEGDFRPPEDCVDPDACVDGAVEERACGERGDGLESRTCALGQWADWSPCIGACVDECAAGETRCEGPAVIACDDVDDDPCFEFGAPMACEGACVDGACAPPPAGGIIINELFYDEDGGDGPGVFIELWGPPGASVDGLRLAAVNGANGATYATIDLAGAIGEDGYYVVAHTDATPELAALADLLDGAADLQNGPDNLQLVDAEGVLDALAYGNVGANFFGETAGAADVPPGTALTRIDHGDTDDNSVDFVPRAPSPRAEP